MNAVTMFTSPKSSLSRRRASTIRDPVRRTNVPTCATTETSAPRAVFRFRSLSGTSPALVSPPSVTRAIPLDARKPALRQLRSAIPVQT